LITAVVVLIFGGLTLYLDSDIFIKMKPTIVNSLFALILFAGLAFGKSFLKPLLGFAFQLHDRGWKLLSLRWAIFFVFLAIVNEFVWRTQSTDFWVGFKVFGNLPMTLIFVGFQMPLLKRYTIAPDQPGGSQ
ncbi:MAG: inner membrane-spanning protein YciB, partial [Alphaproteobacteria bacterium]